MLLFKIKLYICRVIIQQLKFTKMEAIDKLIKASKSTSIKAKAMARAWAIFKTAGFRASWYGDFGKCLKRAWEIEKEILAKQTSKVINSCFKPTHEGYMNFYSNTVNFGD